VLRTVVKTTLRSTDIYKLLVAGTSLQGYLVLGQLEQYYGI
jgi:hypothetical protein